MSVIKNHLSLQRHKPVNQRICAPAFWRQELKVSLAQLLFLFLLHLTERDASFNLLLISVPDADDSEAALQLLEISCKLTSVPLVDL